MKGVELDFETCRKAATSRDSRFDGVFVTAVRSTMIYCRPSCPAITPKRENVRFLPTAAAAQREGFRACLRCRPDAAPGSPDWDVRGDVVGRAMRLIADGVVDRDGVPGLAGRLGYTERHLHRMLTAEVGAGPLALARAQRAQTARVLIETTGLGLAEIAFASGFGSVRQFNDTIREIYGRTPSQLRERRARPELDEGLISVRLPYRAPLHAEALLTFLGARAVTGIDGLDAQGYHRNLRLPHGPGRVTLAPREGHVAAALRLTDVRDLAPAVARCRRLFDLDADPAAVDAVLGADPALAPMVLKEEGVRVPRATDGFEIAVRAVVGQQISVAAARTVLRKLVDAAAGQPPSPNRQGFAVADSARGPAFPPSPNRQGFAVADSARGPALPPSPNRQGFAVADSARGPGFPTAEELLGLPDEAFAMPEARRRTLRGLAAAVAAGELDLDGGGDRGETVEKLKALPGIGDWTAQYTAMRALGDPDAFLPTDLGLLRGARAAGLPDTPKTQAAHAERWRPWRSYAAIRLWRMP
jgi:AraC family transcriptional regulator of adaptative response / DNA-3-methyladenine glycosylase II